MGNKLVFYFGLSELVDLKNLIYCVGVKWLRYTDAGDLSTNLILDKADPRFCWVRMFAVIWDEAAYNVWQWKILEIQEVCPDASLWPMTGEGRIKHWREKRNGGEDI